MMNSRKISPASPATAFSMALMTSHAALHRSRAVAIGPPRRKKHHRDKDDEPVHERRVADERAGLGIAQRRPDGNVSSAKNASTARTAHVGVLQPSLLLRRSRLRAAPAARRCMAPSRGSTIFSVMSDTTNVSRNTDAIENQKFAVRSIEIVGIEQVDRVVGDPGQHAVERLDENVDAEHRGHAREGCGEPGERDAGPDSKTPRRPAGSGRDNRHPPRCSTATPMNTRM